MSRSNKLLPKHRGPYQVIGHEQSIRFDQRQDDQDAHS